MKKILLASAFLAVASAPALAAGPDTAIIMWTNGVDAVTATGTGSVDLGPQNLAGVGVTLTFGNKGTGPNELNEANIQITNNDTSTQMLNIILGANGFSGPSDLFKLSGAINTDTGNADLKGFYFVDGGDTLNGTVESVTGNEINLFDSLSLGGSDAFHFNGFGSDSVTGQYGMAEWLQLSLTPGASVGIQGVSMEAVVPEPRTWASLLIGFGALAAMGWKRSSRSTGSRARYAI